MINVGWLLAALAAAAAEPQVEAAARFEPLDAQAVRTLDWTGVADGALWADASAPRSGQQLGETSAWRVAKVARTRFDGTDADLALQVEKASPTKRRMVLSLPVVPRDSCGPARARLTEAFGAPSAERVYETDMPLPDTRLLRKHAQWPAGESTVTLDCMALKKGEAGAYLTQVEFEPASDALPLVPLFALDCPALLPPDRKTRAPSTASVLIVDPRERRVMRPGNQPTLGAWGVSVSDGEVAFELADAQVRIDRVSGRYTATPRKKKGAIREGVCMSADVPS